ncbi:cell division protein FtsZ [Salmonella enterica]|nr:cell division protein FtsZ [Salmonella enterica]EAV2866454.1 cell division protein FtsZ [Salmonella enterica]
MSSRHDVTKSVPRRDVLPGTIVKYKGHAWRASANTNSGLYLTTAVEKTRINVDYVEIYLNPFGNL